MWFAEIYIINCAFGGGHRCELVLLFGSDIIILNNIVFPECTRDPVGDGVF